MNKVILIGNLGRDPEVKYTAGGTAVANLSVATSWRNKDGEDQTEWHRCVAFGKTAEIIGQHLSKGSKLALEGRIQTRKWQDKEGTERYTTEVIMDRFEFVGGRGESQDRPSDSFRAPAPQADDGFDEDIPF